MDRFDWPSSHWSSNRLLWRTRIHGAQCSKAPLDAAAVALNADTRVTDQLGTPISYGSGISLSHFKNDNGNASADIDTNFSGPEGGAHVVGTMQLNAGTWSVDHLTVTFEDGTEVELP